MTASAALRCAMGSAKASSLKRTCSSDDRSEPRAVHVLLIAKSAPDRKFRWKRRVIAEHRPARGQHARWSGLSCVRCCVRRPAIGAGRRGRQVRVGDLLKRHQFATEFLDCSDQPEQLRLVANMPGQDGGAVIPVESHGCE